MGLDAELARAAATGDEDSFRALYREVQPGLLRYLRGLVGDDAEDVASEAWLQIARDLRAFRGDGAGFRGWAASVARHRALDHLRYRHRRPSTAEPDELFVHLPATDDTEERALESVSMQAAVAWIATLPRDQAEAILLRVVVGLDVATTAQVLGKRSGAVRTSTHRGLRRLARELEQDPSAGAPPTPRSAVGVTQPGPSTPTEDR
jgi:RNA polymerase sigma-70 factor (ECF subfamily)